MIYIVFVLCFISIGFNILNYFNNYKNKKAIIDIVGPHLDKINKQIKKIFEKI